MGNRNWRGRAFTSLCSLVNFIFLLLTAIILYIEPHGRVADWTKWNFLGLKKVQWGNLHLFSGLLFLTITSGSVWTPELIGKRFAGTGVGRKSIGQIIRNYSCDPKTVYQCLERSNIKATEYFYIFHDQGERPNLNHLNRSRIA
jgi:hypothetical protein